jgi:hypothetical protein
MPRVVEITVAPHKTDLLLEQMSGLDGLLGLRVQRGLSMRPQGDVVTALLRSDAFHGLLQVLERREWSAEGGDFSLTITDPTGVVVRGSEDLLARESSDAGWEEMLRTIAKESNMHHNGLLLMAFSGLIAAIGVATGTLHFVIAGMLLAPGFEPLTRVALSVLTGAERWQASAFTALKAHLALFAGALLGTLLLLAFDRLPPGRMTYLPGDTLIDFWSGFSPTTMAVSVVAAAAGVLVVAADRSVLTTGAMVGLALVPGPAIFTLGLFMGDAGLAARGLLRWALEVALVLLLSFVVLAWKRAVVHKRKALI